MHIPFFHSKIASIIIKMFLGIAAACIVFQLGVWKGFHDVSTPPGFSSQYHDDFGQGPGFIPDGAFLGSHSAFGVIVEKHDNAITLASPDTMEKVVLISTTTAIEAQDTATTTDALALGEAVTVIGIPNDQGQIRADIISITSHK
jgi:hypothetical protein